MSGPAGGRGCAVRIERIGGATLYCGDCLRLKVPEKSRGGAVRWPVSAVSAVFIVLIGLNLMAQSIFYGDSLTLEDLKTCASIDLFEANDYKLSYLISGGSEAGVADQYAQDLAQEESNSITIPLAQYYAGAGQIDNALDTLDHGSDTCGQMKRSGSRCSTCTRA